MSDGSKIEQARDAALDSAARSAYRVFLDNGWTWGGTTSPAYRPNEAQIRESYGELLRYVLTGSGYARTGRLCVFRDDLGMHFGVTFADYDHKEFCDDNGHDYCVVRADDQDAMCGRCGTWQSEDRKTMLEFRPENA